MGPLFWPLECSRTRTFSHIALHQDRIARRVRTRQLASPVLTPIFPLDVCSKRHGYSFLFFSLVLQMIIPRIHRIIYQTSANRRITAANRMLPATNRGWHFGQDSTPRTVQFSSEVEVLPITGATSVRCPTACTSQTKRTAPFRDS